MTKKLLFSLLSLISFCISGYAQLGFTCANAIPITTLPFQTTDNTGNYGDTSDQSQPVSCAGTATNYMTGNDVFYQYTPANSETISIKMTPTAGWSGIFVYDSCANVGNACVAGVANSGSAIRLIPQLNVIAGHNYIIVISTNAAPQTIGYSLEIQSIFCAAPLTLFTANIGDTTADLSWGNPGNASSWQLALQPAGNGVPASGITVNGNPAFTASGLSPVTSYEYWVRAACGDGNFSPWTGPKVFSTSSCPVTAQCTYSFNATDTFGDGWNGNTMTVFQNGVSVGNISLSGSSSIINMPLCNDAPFELVWNAGGQFASEVGISIRNPFGQVIYTKPAGTGTQNSSLYTGTVNCITAMCMPPSSLSLGTLSGNSLTFTWDNFNGGQWEVVLLPTGSPAPGPTDSGSIVTTNSYTTSVTTGVAYTFYVRTICEGNATSSWSTSTFIPVCSVPANLLASSTSATEATLTWVETGAASQWEVLVLPFSTPFTPTLTGQLTTTIPYVATDLAEAANYRFYVRAVCSSNVNSGWSTPFYFWQPVDNPPINDECLNAVLVPVNSNAGCAQTVSGTSFGATFSSPALPFSCSVPSERDVWYRFVATATELRTVITRTSGGSATISQAIYSGDCGNLVQINCAYSTCTTSNLSVGAIYFIRVITGPDTVGTNFNVCITPVPNCNTSNSVCGIQNYANITGIPNLGQMGCLYTTPNASFFSVKIATSGSVKLVMTQSSLGSPTPNLDVDYAAWGPFPSQIDACDAITPYTPPLSGLTTGCSYSAAATERFNINNALAGEYYIILITNFSNAQGFINITVDPTSTGSIDCTGIRLNAFIDANGNGTQENGEQNFPLGQFHYEVNNDGNVHNVISPTGIYTIYDSYTSNTYALSHSINSDYSAMYSTASTYSNVVVSAGGMATYNFPVTVLQNYTDLAVSISPVSVPRAGTTYKNKIVYTNNGNQAISGTLTFNRAPETAITDISQPGSALTPTGFTYNFIDLQPFESRTITVTLSVPTIPAVSIGQLLTGTASITLPSGDIVPANNNSTLSQAIVAAFDPNDKIEAHGEKIVFSTFAPNDYLQYTVRFENTGSTTATNISLVDILDQKLDETSLVMVSASHDYTLDRVSRNLTWKFNEIFLPVSVSGSDTGKGFVTFKIKLKPGFAIGDIIPNTASIYFDTNPAIVTNTFNTEFIAFLSNADFDQNNVMVYPNPASGSVQVNLQNTAANLESITLYDLVGKVIKKTEHISSAQAVIDVSALSSGIYLLEVTTENQMKLVKKLMIK
jgi:uncharacterized repeat protein (TIGR01451 family)